MFAVMGQLAYLAGVGNDPEAPLFQYSKQANDYDKDRSFRDLWLQ
jgi:deoxyribodipyrimidine photo-lyase